MGFSQKANLLVCLGNGLFRNVILEYHYLMNKSTQRARQKKD